MKSLLCNLLSFVCILTLASCSFVQTITPVAMETEKSLQEDLAGTWKLDNGIFNVAFDKKGVGRFAATYWENEQFKTDLGILNAVRKSEDSDSGFLSFRIKEEDVADEELAYNFFAFKIIDDDSVLIWEPDPFEAHERFLSDKELDGKIEGEDYKTITFDDGEKLVSKVDNFSKFFDLENPKVISRALPKEESEDATED